MTSNNSNNVNNANGGESGNSADGAIEGVAIEAAANVTGSEQRQAAVNDAAVADVSVTNGSAGGWGVEPSSARLGIGSRQLRAVPAMRRTVRCRGATARDRVRRGTRRMRRRRQ